MSTPTPTPTPTDGTDSHFWSADQLKSHFWSLADIPGTWSAGEVLVLLLIITTTAVIAWRVRRRR